MKIKKVHHITGEVRYVCLLACALFNLGWYSTLAGSELFFFLLGFLLAWMPLMLMTICRAKH